MLETKIFTENPLKIYKRICIIFGIFVLLLSFVLFLFGNPQITDNGLNKSALGIVIWWAVFIIVLLIMFLAGSFESKKTLKCDSNECEILNAKFWFWQSANQIGKFKWSEVTDTNIVSTEEERVSGDGVFIFTTYTFVVQTKDGALDLMDLKTSSKDNIRGLINYVNEAAQQTKYIWVKDSEIENRLVVDSNYGYSKVARNS